MLSKRIARCWSERGVDPDLSGLQGASLMEKPYDHCLIARSPVVRSKKVVIKGNPLDCGCIPY